MERKATMGEGQKIQAIEAAFREIARNFEELSKCAPDIALAAELMVKAVAAGCKVMFCGNGGSAADAQHLAAELMGRYLRERRPLPSMALTVDTSALTAIGNDYSFADIFARQVEGMGISGDVLVGISTSGNSGNVVKALQTARAKGIGTVGLTGASGGSMRECCDVCICVPATVTNRIQEMHLAVGHLLCGFVEDSV